MRGIPGSFAAAYRGQAHQIWRARKTIAVAPPSTLPSAVATRISRSKSLGGKARRACTRGSCKAARPKPRFSRGRRKRRAIEVQMVQSRSKKTQPREACFPFVSVISELREIMSHQKRRSPAFSLSAAQQLAKPAAEFYQSLQGARREAAEFLEQSAEQDDEFQQLLHVLARVGVRRARFLGFRHALPHHGNRGIKFPALALLQDHAE